MPAASLLFDPVERPQGSALAAHARAGAGFSITLDPAAVDSEAAAGGHAGNWLELLANGLTFDLTGLAPGGAADTPPRGHSYGLPEGTDDYLLEAITLRPGPHLAGGATMLPVVRTLASLAAQLTVLPGARAVAWHPARSWCAADRFCDAVLRWLDGGAFPAFALAALSPTNDGGMQSEGMALFAGQELRLEPDVAEDRAAAAKIGVRLLHWLSEHGRLTGPERINGIEGVVLRLEPSANGRFVRVWKG